jgi:hypothetical protein
MFSDRKPEPAAGLKDTAPITEDLYYEMRYLGSKKVKTASV